MGTLNSINRASFGKKGNQNPNFGDHRGRPPSTQGIYKIFEFVSPLATASASFSKLRSLASPSKANWQSRFSKGITEGDPDNVMMKGA